MKKGVIALICLFSLFLTGVIPVNAAETKTKASDYIYSYYELYENNSLVRIHKTTLEKKNLTKHKAFYVKNIGDWVYYEKIDSVNQAEGMFQRGEVYKIRYDGTGDTKVIKDEISAMLVTDNYIFYSMPGDKFATYRVGLDGKGKIKVSGDSNAWMQTDGKWIYYLNFTDWKLYKMDMEGKNRTKLSDDTIYYFGDYFLVSDGKIAYSVDSEKNYIMDTNGKNKKLLNNADGGVIAIKGDYIYGCDYRKSQIVKVDINGKNKSVVANNVNWIIHTDNDSIYFTDSTAKKAVHKIVIGQPKPSVIPAPSGFKAAIADKKTLILGWNNVTDAKQYRIYFSTNASKNYTLIKTSDYPQNTFTLAYNFIEGNTYNFQVCAVDEKGMEGPRSSISKLFDTTPPKLENADPYKGKYVGSGDNISIRFNEPVKIRKSELIQAYNVDRNNLMVAKLNVSLANDKQTLIISRIKGEAWENLNTYKIRIKPGAIEDINSNYNTGEISFTFKAGDKPSTPTELKAVMVDSSNVGLSWKAVKGASSYIVYKSAVQSGEYKQIGKVTANTYRDKGVAAGTTCWYKVSAVNVVGEGSKSIPVSVTSAPVKVTSITLDKNTTGVNLGESAQLKAIIQPANATNKKVIWSSDKPNFVSVDQNGVIKGISIEQGQSHSVTTITAKTDDGGITATCTVTVMYPSSLQPSSESAVFVDSKGRLTDKGEQEVVEAMGPDDFINIEVGSNLLKNLSNDVLQDAVVSTLLGAEIEVKASVETLLKAVNDTTLKGLAQLVDIYYIKKSCKRYHLFEDVKYKFYPFTDCSVPAKTVINGNEYILETVDIVELNICEKGTYKSILFTSNLLNKYWVPEYNPYLTGSPYSLPFN